MPRGGVGDAKADGTNSLSRTRPYISSTEKQLFGTSIVMPVRSNWNAAKPSDRSQSDWPGLSPNPFQNLNLVESVRKLGK